MPTEVWVALLGLTGIVVGYFLRPIGELSGEIIRDRREESHRRERFQFDTLVALATALEEWRLTTRVLSASAGGKGQAAEERVRALTHRVKDDELRALLERLLSIEGDYDAWSKAHDAALSRLGRVLREM